MGANASGHPRPPDFMRLFIADRLPKRPPQVLTNLLPAIIAVASKLASIPMVSRGRPEAAERYYHYSRSPMPLKYPNGYEPTNTCCTTMPCALQQSSNDTIC